MMSKHWQIKKTERLGILAEWRVPGETMIRDLGTNDIWEAVYTLLCERLESIECKLDKLTKGTTNENMA
jgi:hypothetical protein